MKHAGLLFLIFGCVYGYRPYGYVINGAKTEAAGRVVSVGLLSSEALFNNPAFLPGLSNELIYEFDSELGFRGFTTDYRFSFDFSSLGYAFGGRDKKGKEKHYGISYSTLFRSSSLENTQQFSTPDLTIRTFGFSQGLKLGNQVSFGYRVGLAVAIDSIRGFGNSSFTMFPTAQLGVVYSPNRHVLIGGFVSSPLYLDWKAFSDYDLVESTPFSLSSGVRVRLSPNLALLTELNYQGWDGVSYQLRGVGQHIDKGDSLFDYGQNVFVNVGVYLHGESKQHRADWQEKINPQTAGIKKEIRAINEQLIELDKKDPLTQLKQESFEQLKQKRELQDFIASIERSTLSAEQSAELSFIKKEIAQKKKQVREKHKEKTNVVVLFGAKQIREGLEQDLQALNLEIENLQDKANELQYGSLLPEHRSALSNSHIALKALSQSNRNLNVKIAELKKNQKSYVSEIVKIAKKGDKGKALSPEEKLIYNHQLERDRLLALRKEKVKSLKKIQTGNRLPVRGEFYLGYAPEVRYQNDGRFRKLGNMTFGFSFRPTNIRNLYVTLSLTDKTLLKLMQAHPQNDPLELVKVTSSYHFK